MRNQATTNETIERIGNAIDRGIVDRLGLGESVRAYRECFEDGDHEGCQRVLENVK